MPNKRPAKTSGHTAQLSNPAVDCFAKKIQTAWQKAVSSILETGRLLIQAKQELAPGKFLLMVEERLPFGARTAQMLMRIAERPILSNAKFISHLPPSWGTLYLLIKFPDEVLESLFLNGKITCETTSAEAKKLLSEYSSGADEDKEAGSRSISLSHWNGIKALAQVKQSPAEYLKELLSEEKLDVDQVADVVSQTAEWINGLAKACTQQQAADREARRRALNKRIARRRHQHQSASLEASA